MHLRRGAQDRFDQCESHSGQGMETTSEFVADQKPDGDVLDPLRREKKSNFGGPVFVSPGRAPKRKGAQTIRDLLQVRFCAQSIGPRCLSTTAYLGAAAQD